MYAKRNRAVKLSVFSVYFLVRRGEAAEGDGITANIMTVVVKLVGKACSCYVKNRVGINSEVVLRASVLRSEFRRRLSYYKKLFPVKIAVKHKKMPIEFSAAALIRKIIVFFNKSVGDIRIIKQLGNSAFIMLWHE
ncbi:hypothetical protein SDC9_171165 [bioreactor metagenome]|uniref:Uncharacterized protein n=1 Tax=bioreactor metagenome TaxID=1076179 RepID=A0A645GCQ3_9ZZZZ